MEARFFNRLMLSVTRGRQFLQHVVPAVMRPLRILWNQIIGFIFLVLAVAAAPRAYRSWREFDGDTESFFRLLLTGIFIGMMGGFALYSFWRAHKVTRS